MEAVQKAQQGNAGEFSPTGDPFRAMREQYKGKNAPHGRVLTAALIVAVNALGETTSPRPRMVSRR